MARVYLSLGSNLGERLEYLKEAVRRIDDFYEMEVVAVSSVYETEPVGYADQSSFLNCVIAVETELTPREVLVMANIVEHRLKRERTIRWGPRTIDVDILLYDDLTMDDPNLTIPHPRMCERAFVMVPLLEIAQEIDAAGLCDVKECELAVAGQYVKKIGSLKR